MALTCSVLGHAYGDPTVERDREERGSEVVVTVREYETCTRCGNTRIVSENKEVTAVEADADVDGPVTDRTTDLDVAEEDVAAATAGPDGDAAGGTDAPAESEDPSADEETPNEGAEILDAEAGEPVDDAVDEELASPSVADEGVATDEGPVEDEPADDEDAVVISSDDADADERAPGEWPEEDEPADEPEWSPPSEPAESSTSSPEPTPEPTAGSTVTVPEGEFECEECGYSTPVEASSLRAGDFCPDCRVGTLTHVRDS